MPFRLKMLAPLGVLLCLFVALCPVVAFAETPQEQLAIVAQHVDASLAALANGDRAAARSEYAAFDSGWRDIEDGIRDISKVSYAAIEGALGDSDFALNSDPFNQEAARQGLERLKKASADFISGRAPSSDQAPTTPSDRVTMASEMAHLDKALALIDRADAHGAQAEIAAFRQEWVIVEGIVAVKSQEKYLATENNMARAYGLLGQASPDMAGARETIVRMKADLSPYAQGEARYSVFDATIILLREGLEAILVIAALLAFLSRSGNGDKRGWVWLGSGAGILVSLVGAFIIGIALRGANSSLLQGGSALFAAGMLLYMSFWLHSKSNLASWHKYISSSTSTALKRNSLVPLAVLAFLAVFREGIETVLFYVGMASGISLGDFALGVALGILGVGTIGTLIFSVGMRISVGPFFRVASLLVYYLGFKFAGAGVHALQIAGKVPVTLADYLPTNSFFGLYPTWQTTSVQMVFLGFAACILLYERFRPAARRRTVSTASPVTGGTRTSG